MRTRCLGAYLAAIFLVAVRATTTVWVDDDDPGIEYRGDWIHNPISDPKDFNYGGSMTFTNVSGSTATGFEPLGSPSSASPLLPRRPRGMRNQKDSPIAPSAGTSRYLSPPDDRRRSMDGGVRLAGGPAEEVPEQEDARGDDVRSGLSTLPPAYGLYPGA